MAKKNNEKSKSIEETLWQSCDKLRGSVDPSEYKHVVLGLIFLKFASDKFEQRREELLAEGKEKYVEMKDFYNMKNVFFLEEISRWSYISKNAKQNDLALKIDTALHTIEKDNPSLKGALPDNYFSRLGLDRSKLASLVDKINEINTLTDQEQDIIGRVYEYFLRKFAIKEGKGKGEFYTPKTIVNLMVELIEPYKGVIYDPACGSGGMFVQSVKFIESHQGNKKEVSIYGQESSPTTYKLAKMNLAIRGISANLGEKHADTFINDQHKDLKADFIIANPPYNQKDWRSETQLIDDTRWKGYEVPPKSNANFAWILHMLDKLSLNGTASFILSNGSLSSTGVESEIRKKLVDNDVLEAIMVLPMDMFYTTDTSVTLWILNKNKKAGPIFREGKEFTARDRRHQYLFIDARNYGVIYEKKYIKFRKKEDIASIAEIYHSWKFKDLYHSYKDIPELCYSASIQEIIENDYFLMPSQYIPFNHQNEEINIDEELESVTSNFSSSLNNSKELNERILEFLKG